MTKNHAIMPPQSWATIVAFSRPEMIEIQKYLVLVSKKKKKQNKKHTNKTIKY